MPGAAWAGCSESAREQANELKFSPQFFTVEQLADHDGTGLESMLLLAIRSSSSEAPIVLDVAASGEEYYGPGRPYHCFTGRDCSRAFSLSSLAKTHHHGNMSGASEAEWNTLDEWFKKLSSKYPMVGTLLLTPTELSPSCEAVMAADGAEGAAAGAKDRTRRSSSEESETKELMAAGYNAESAPASDAAEDDWKEVC